ncbi:hypothetical protein L2E82_45304 [Cichorium intybus]|uniref:Uncharacterized protein n=1 Tax=Cichorium intybus TaxID=13427 RepID=A0ACB8ZS70_CICIN|nr:hypothetical protein L2E82_45304 [Cichorium intybus]
MSSSDDGLDEAIDLAISIRQRIIEELDSGESSNTGGHTRRFIERERDAAQQRLFKEYFIDNSTYSDYQFRRRFRMNKSLFLKIVGDVEAANVYFKQRPNAAGILGFHPIQKCTAALRMLAYGTIADALDESIRMAERTSRETLQYFCETVIHLYQGRYMRAPTPNDIRQLYAHHGHVHGFPGMLGNVDCMHRRWDMCPNAWHGQYTKGNYGYPTVVLQAAASQDLWFWHSFFGEPGSNNDINVLNSSDLYDDLYKGTAPDSSFILRGIEYRYGYYLVDGIYPEHSVLVKTLTCPSDPQRKRFKRAQERARKDIERAFGVLKKRFHIISKPALFRHKSTMQKVMYTCMILHNMIIEHEGRAICQYDENEIIPPRQAHAPGTPGYRQRVQIVHDFTIHGDLRRHLIDHLWTLNHLDLNVPPPVVDDDEFSDEDHI